MENRGHHLASLRYRREIQVWNFLSANSFLRRQKALACMVAMEMEAGLIAGFNRAAAGTDRSCAAGHVLFHDSHLGVAGRVARLKLTARCIGDWEEARRLNDFGRAAVSLESLVSHIRDEARRKADAGGFASPYEALIDSHVPGLTDEHLQAWCENLKSFCGSIPRDTAAGNPESPFRFPYMVQEEAKNLAQGVLSVMGFRKGDLKIAQTAHPLCVGRHEDVRLGLNFLNGDVLPFILDVVHEGGHAQYRRHLSPLFREDARGDVAGAGMDEAVALLWSEHIGRSSSFLRRVVPHIRIDNTAAYISDSRSLGNILAEQARVPERQGLRVNADEVRYPLDLILRIDLERRLINESLPVAELPDLWRQGFKKLTGISVTDDNYGVLQDIHWFGGQVGRFPSYMFGRLAAAQIFEAILYDRPDVDPDLYDGWIIAVQQWMTEKIYQKGAKTSAFDLIEALSARPLGTAAFKGHIRARYAHCFAPEGPNPGYPALKQT